MTPDNMDDLIVGLNKFEDADFDNMSEQELDTFLISQGLDPETAPQQAKSRVDTLLSAPRRSAKIFDLAKARLKLQKLADTDSRLEQLTLAARQGGEISDAEIQFLIEDLIELGVIDESEFGSD
jgi:hypothetical protein